MTVCLNPYTYGNAFVVSNVFDIIQAMRGKIHNLSDEQRTQLLASCQQYAHIWNAGANHLEALLPSCRFHIVLVGCCLLSLKITSAVTCRCVLTLSDNNEKEEAKWGNRQKRKEEQRQEI